MASVWLNLSSFIVLLCPGHDLPSVTLEEGEIELGFGPWPKEAGGVSFNVVTRSQVEYSNQFISYLNDSDKCVHVNHFSLIGCVTHKNKL